MPICHIQSVLDIGTSSTFAARATMGTTVLGRSQPLLGTESPGHAASPTQASAEATRAQVEQIRLLVLGMEQRMQEREEKLSKTIERAETQEIKCEELRKEVLPTKVAV